MSIELPISAVVLLTFGAMIVRERMAVPDPKSPRRVGWRATVERADFLLVGCVVLCLVILWLPVLFR